MSETVVLVLCLRLVPSGCMTRRWNRPTMSCIPPVCLALLGYPLICTAARSRQDLQPVQLFSRHSTLCLMAALHMHFARSQEDFQPVEPIFITTPPCWSPLICTAARSQLDLQPVEPIFSPLHLTRLPSYALLPGPSKIYSQLSLFFHHSTFAMNMQQNKQDINT